jgi:hypothetical protein
VKAKVCVSLQKEKAKAASVSFAPATTNPGLQSRYPSDAG